MVLTELGVNVAPIIASAGIVGVALGFGAQSLVKDFLSGIFMIFEDQYGVGDVVDLGEASGTVEAVSLRVTRLRDVNGTVWYVRNGEILRVGNMSQNWARTVLDIDVAYGEDLAKVRRVLQEVAHDLWEDEDFKGLIIEEPEVWGVEALDPDGVTVRVTLKTAPLEQWEVAREMRERIKARFDYEGIEIPFPQRVVWHRDDASRTPRASAAVTAAGRRGPSESTDGRARRRSGEGGVERDRGAGQRLADRAVGLGVLGGLDEVLLARCPSTAPTTVRWMPVMPVPGVNSTSAVVSSAVRRRAGLGQAAGERHREAGRVGRGDELLGAGLAVGLLGAGGPGDVVRAEAGLDSRVTWPAPSKRVPSQWVFAVRVVLMRTSLLEIGGRRAIFHADAEPPRPIGTMGT